MKEGNVKHAGNNQSPKESKDPTIELVLCDGVTGKCIYLNNHRIVGPKPWGGATSQKNIKIKLSELEEALQLKEGSLNHLKEEA